MRIAIPLALFTAAAFSTQSLPVRAFPNASVNLVRIDREGIKPLPDVQLLLSQGQPAPAPQAGGTAAAGTEPEALPDDLTWLLSPGDELEISFGSALPASASGELVLRVAPAPTSGLSGSGDPGEVVERIPFPSPQVFLSEDGLFMAIQPETLRKPGEITTVIFEVGVVPDPDTPVRFALAQPAIAMERKQAPCPYVPLPGSQAAAQAAGQAAAASGAAAAGTAGWVVPAILGIAAIAAGAAIISSSGGGGNNKRGGRNVSSQ